MKGGQTVNHEYYEELISARLDGLLTEEEERELDEHLASCPDCRRARREMDTVHRMLLAASPLPPEGLEDRILDELPDQPRRRSPWMKKAAPLAAAAVFLLAVVGITKTVANFHSNVNQDVVQAESAQAAEENEEASDSAKTEGAKEDKDDKDSVGAFGKDTEEDAEAETEEAAEKAADQKPAAVSSQDKSKTQTATQSKDKSKAQTATQSKDKKSTTAKTESKKTDTAKAAETKPAAQNSQAKPAEAEAKPEAAAAQPAEAKAETTGGGGGAGDVKTEAAETEEAAAAPAAPEPAASAAAQSDAAPAEDEDPEAPAQSGSTLTWQQARERLDVYLDGPQDDLSALGMDSSGTHWLFTTGGKTYAVDIHTGAVSQR